MLAHTIDSSAEAIGVAVEVMDFIAERRRQLFPDLRTSIVDYEVQIAGGRLSLNVSSAPIPDVGFEGVRASDSGRG